MKHIKALRDVFKKQAVAAKKASEPANDLWRERKRETVGGTVLNVEEDAGTRNLTILLDEGVDIDFSAGGGVGVPGMVGHQEIVKIIDNLLLSGDDEKELAHELIQPTTPYPGILLATPDVKLLTRIAEKLQTAGTEFSKKRTFLENILKDPQKIEKLQATYSVADVLQIFSGLITKEDLLNTQGPAHGNKTYSLIDFGYMADDAGQQRQYIKISVLPEGGLHEQNMFGEVPKSVLHLGETSSYLYDLDKGDVLRVSKEPKNKDNFKVPDDPSNGLILIGQGNGVVSFITLLKELKKQKAAGQKIGSVDLIIAANDMEAVWGLSFLKPYLEDGTIRTLNIALSGTDKTLGITQNDVSISGAGLSEHAQNRIRIHHGTRLADSSISFDNIKKGLFDPEIEKNIHKVLGQGGGVYISSSNPFQLTMNEAIVEIAKRHGTAFDDYQGSVRVSKSPSRIQGEKKGWSKRIAGKNLTNLQKKKP